MSCASECFQLYHGSREQNLITWWKHFQVLINQQIEHFNFSSYNSALLFSQKHDIAPWKDKLDECSSWHQNLAIMALTQRWRVIFQEGLFFPTLPHFRTFHFPLNSLQIVDFSSSASSLNLFLSFSLFPPQQMPHPQL